MIKNIIKWFKRNPCEQCDFYHKENNTCQSKKCATCGVHPYVTKLDRLFCDSYHSHNN